jgi:hypothetical protein
MQSAGGPTPSPLAREGGAKGRMRGCAVRRMVSGRLRADPSPRVPFSQGYDIHTSFSACAGAFDLTPYSGSSDSGGGRGADAGGVRDERLKGARAERAACGDGKTTNIKPYPKPSQAPLPKGRSRSKRPGRPRVSVLARIPAPSEKFPASPLREICRKDLKSRAFSTRILPQSTEFPANSLRAGNFSPHPASKGRSAAASSTDPIWAHPAKSGVLVVDLFECGSPQGERGAPRGWGA